MPEIADGEVLVHVSHLAFDPSMKSWMENAVSYFPPTAIGDVMPGEGYGTVAASRNSEFEAGDAVTGFFGWQDFAAVRTANLRRPPADIAPVAALSVLGSSGLTAFFGVFEIGRPRPGDVMLVSSAAGAVGSIAGQLGRIAGCRVTGIAGGDAKCDWLTRHLGFHDAIDRHHGDLDAQLERLAPQGVDVFFDNVGGQTLNTVLAHIARRARIVICGGMSRHEEGRPPTVLDNYYNVVFERARIEGFNVVDYRDRHPWAMGRLESWLRSGEIRYREPVVEGFDRAPAALMGVFAAASFGKQVLKISG